MFLGYYIAYTAYLLMGAMGHEVLPVFSTTMLSFVFPISILTVALALFRSRVGSAGGAR